MEASPGPRPYKYGEVEELEAAIRDHAKRQREEEEMGWENLNDRISKEPEREELLEGQYDEEARIREEQIKKWAEEGKSIAEIREGLTGKVTSIL